MNNDDFLKKHQGRTRPRPEFVEDLYESINTKRSPLMITKRMHPAFLTLIVILTMALLTLTILPTARASIRSLMTINGVGIDQNEQTGELIVSGNTDAVVSQTEDTVVIESGVDDSVIVIDAESMSPEMISVDDVEAQYPDFVMPTTVPDGYGIIPMAFMAGENGIGVGWQNSEGHQITYTWNVDPIEASAEEEAEMIEKGIELIDGFRYSFMVLGDSVILSGAENGIGYLLIATDTSLTEADLQAILP